MQRRNFTAAVVITIIAAGLQLETAGELLLEFLQGSWYLEKYRERGITVPEMKTEGINANYFCEDYHCETIELGTLSAWN